MSSQSIRKKRSTSKINFEKNYVLTVFKSNLYTSAQVLEPKTKRTLFTVSTKKVTTGTKTEKAKEIGKIVAEKLKELKVDKIIFNRNGFLYHGRIAAIADSIRENGVTI